jgi:hypothetical protein
MYLLYINALKKNHRGENIYEFIFGKTTIIEYGEGWDSVPASGNEDITPPPLECIDVVGLLITESDMELDVVQESDTFSVIDAVDTIVALGWETTPIDGIDRLVFHFGDTLEKVKDKLYSRDLELNFENNKKYATTYEKD